MLAQSRQLGIGCGGGGGGGEKRGNVCIDETKYSPEDVGMLLQPQQGVQSCLSYTNVVLVWLFKTSTRVSRNVMCKVAIKDLKKKERSGEKGRGDDGRAKE